jgi:hypothetical protein
MQTSQWFRSKLRELNFPIYVTSSRPTNELVDCGGNDPALNFLSDVQHRKPEHHSLVAVPEHLAPHRISGIEMVTPYPLISHNRNAGYACGTAVFVNEQLLILFKHLEVAMNSASSVSIRAIPETPIGFHPLKAIALFCGLVLGASLCLATYGLDLSAGFF